MLDEQEWVSPRGTSTDPGHSTDEPRTPREEAGHERPQNVSPSVGDAEPGQDEPQKQKVSERLPVGSPEYSVNPLTTSSLTILFRSIA